MIYMQSNFDIISSLFSIRWNQILLFNLIGKLHNCGLENCVRVITLRDCVGVPVLQAHTPHTPNPTNQPDTFAQKYIATVQQMNSYTLQQNNIYTNVVDNFGQQKRPIKDDRPL